MATTWKGFKKQIKEQFLSLDFDKEIMLEWDDFTSVRRRDYLGVH